MKAFTTILAALAMTLAAGCSRDEGSAENAGAELDKAMEKASDYAGEKIQEAGEAMERAGEELKK